MKRNGHSKKPFNRFTPEEAFQALGIETLIDWKIETPLLPPSPFFEQIMAGLGVFDVERSERSREVLIDAILFEALNRRQKLKVWKEMTIQSDSFSGRADYLFAKKSAF